MGFNYDVLVNFEGLLKPIISPKHKAAEGSMTTGRYIGCAL